MSTAVSICSNALLMLGAETIASFDDDSERAKVAANLYDTVRDAVLRSHPWNCAIKRVILSPEQTGPAFGYAYKFALPGDWLRTISVGDYNEELDFRMEERFLLADDAVVKLRYIFRNDVESTWDVSLIQAMTIGMAAAMAYPITESETRANALEEKFRIYLREARAADGQEEPPETLGDFPLYRSRFLGSTGF